MALAEASSYERDSALAKAVTTLIGHKVSTYVSGHEDATADDVLSSTLVPRLEDRGLVTIEGELAYDVFSDFTERNPFLTPDQRKWFAIGLIAQAGAQKQYRTLSNQ